MSVLYKYTLDVDTLSLNVLDVFSETEKRYVLESYHHDVNIGRYFRKDNLGVVLHDRYNSSRVFCVLLVPDEGYALGILKAGLESKLAGKVESLRRRLVEKEGLLARVRGM